MFWRWAKAGAPPTPGVVAISSGYFALLALLATYQPARTAATLIAVGVDIAALLAVLPATGAPKQVTGWPPPMINDQTVILPPFGGPGAPSLGGSGPGGSMPKGPNTTTPGSPVPPNQGVIFPPGSSAL